MSGPGFVTFAVVLNDLGQLLPYTAQSSISLCEERAEERWGKEGWQKLKDLGAKIVTVEVSYVPGRYRE